MALPVHGVDDGRDAPIYLQFSLFTRQGEESDDMLARWGHPLREMVERSGLKLASRWRTHGFSVRVPSGVVAPSPDEALRNVSHLSLLKLPFVVRGGSEGFEGSPPFPLPRIEEDPTVKVSKPKPAPGSPRLGIWPLPGGVRKYKATLDALLVTLAKHPMTQAEFFDLLRDEYGVTGETAARGYLNVITNTGFAARSNGALQLAAGGDAYLAAPEAAALFEILRERFAGMLEVLVIVESQGRVDVARCNELLMALLGTTWLSTNQVGFRRNWLLSLGATERDAQGGDGLTALGRDLLARHAQPVAEIRARLEDIIEAIGPELEEVRVPAHADHRFRSKPITDSGRSRSPIPEQADR